MQKHVKMYLNHFDIGEQDIWQCEACTKQDYIQKFDSGIVMLTINTIEKWCYYHRYDNTTYKIQYGTDEDFETEFVISKQDGGDFLNSLRKYFISQTQNKDQIQFLFTPIELILDKEKIERLKKHGLLDR